MLLSPLAQKRAYSRTELRVLSFLVSCVIGVGVPLPSVCQQPSSAPASPTLSTLSGTVTDADGAALTRVHVTLSGVVVSPAGTDAYTNSDGRYTLLNVPPGLFILHFTAAGFAPAEATGSLVVGKPQQLPPIVLRVSADANIEVVDSTKDLAEAEVKVEEHQRIAGFVPNFFVAYDWHAPPLSSRQKYELTFHTLLDPASILISAGIAGLEQAENTLPGYGQGAQGYAKRFGANYADFAIGTLVGGAILPAVFHQDPRYFYMGSGTPRHRALYALSTAVVARGDNGRWQPAYASILGDFAAGAASNLYYPAGSRNGAGLTLENGLISVATDGLGNLIQEFIFHKLTPNVPRYSSSPAPTP